MSGYDKVKYLQEVNGPSTLTATIANGASLSDAVKVAGRMAGIITPVAWTAAALTFQASADGTNFFDLYDAATERTLASGAMPTAAQRHLHLPPLEWKSINYVKVRSGTSGSPVNQGAARSVIVVLSPN